MELKLKSSQGAELFCEMDSDKMAFFFNCVGSIQDKRPLWLVTQLEYINANNALSRPGSKVMAMFGEYSEKLEKDHHQELR